MKNLTVMFPGQGSQYVGMAKSFENSEWMKRADAALGFSLSKIMLEGPEDELKLTAFTQPAILTHSVALFDKLQKENIKIARVLGHSVGEYAALVAAKVLSFEDAVMAVHLRGKYMQEAVPVGAGKMVAVMKVPAETIELACKNSSTADEQVMPANYNEPGQIVISGHAGACERAVKWLEENYKETHRCIELNVSAPFHSTLMKPAGEKLAAHFETIKFNANEIAYVANIDAKEYAAGTDGEVIKKNLIAQVDGSVRWTQSVEKLPTDLSVECGPGRVLMGLGRKISRDLKIICLDKEDGFTELQGALS
ncbi:MAG: [acyl-carrier-protein] S-malonyltransferase [Bdellovibrionales bacterium CG12_big_fil_rev_8_21_14_0_65_38_15]|nr:MAG: [acyl-carrier-protein] S-malonyltransferase [Bdellovibrionales bacterium CG22_combo_CG10-13_8_21_14_all_38_13]PIQ53512.1 MAG: [acyl-carrier-protein] S-malonyltransferase [Bdellovibrionales bacterium CG12_big_fil_rev_8_21_14_0_65_38_15]PIR28484.1 MAG: [acyl-carrier-protein] S-malonyltransferase [Bdellovibrionales bacterium CG11_big_fil_rev_8_21_14_0_20_38_13]